MMNSNFRNVALLFLRMTVAAIFFVAAYYKIPFWNNTPEGMSGFMAFMMKFLLIAEGLGAIAILAGFLTFWASGGLLIIMLGAIYLSQFVYNIGFVTPTGAGWNFPLALLACCLVLMAFGPGDWSVDRARTARRFAGHDARVI